VRETDEDGGGEEETNFSFGDEIVPMMTLYKIARNRFPAKNQA
jgi:hypothetical protein